MSRRVARIGVVAALLLLGSVAATGVAAGQTQQERKPLEVAYRRSELSAGNLKATVAMSGTAWTGSQRLGRGNFTATINGRPVEVTEATPLQEQQGERGKVAVVMAVDTSGSMQVNNNIARARAAATALVQRMPQGTRLGLVAFSTEPQVVQPLTEDHNQVRQAIGTLEADGDTALYDAVFLGSQLLAKEQAQRNLVVLSDGRDEGSSASLQGAIAAAKRQGVTVYTVGLNVPGNDQDQAALKQLAAGTGGRAFEVNDANSLVALFGSIGQALASQYVVTMKPPPDLEKRVDFRLQVSAEGTVGAYENPNFLLPIGASPATTPGGPTELSPAPGLSRLESPQGRYVFALAGFAAVLIVCLLLLRPGSSRRPYRALRQRLSPYSLTPAIADDQIRLTAFGSSEWAGKATAMAETLVRRGNLEETFLDRLEAAGLNMRVAEFVLISLGSAFIPPLLALIITRNLLIAGLVVLLGTVAPFLYLSVRASRRQAKFEEQLPSTLQLLSGALQAGHSLQQAVDTVVHEAGDPIAGEFQRVLTEARLGRPLEEAFESMAKRTSSIDFKWTVMAIRLQRQVGGNLAEVLSTVSQTIRDRYALKRQIKALSAEGRLSSLILTILPVVMFVALLLLNPVFLRPLFTSTIGIGMLVSAAVLMVLGVFWLKKITEIKV
jgi:tight adherence protein B